MQHPAPSRRRARAFSLVESLVVLGTLGILVFVLIPVFEVYILGRAPIGDDTNPPEMERLRTRGTYDIRFAPEDAREKAKDPSEKMPVMPE